MKQIKVCTSMWVADELNLCWPLSDFFLILFIKYASFFGIINCFQDFWRINKYCEQPESGF